MTKRALGLLLSWILVINSSTSVFATADVNEAIAENTALVDTEAQIQDPPAGESDEGAPIENATDESDTSTDDDTAFPLQDDTALEEEEQVEIIAEEDFAQDDLAEDPYAADLFGATDTEEDLSELPEDFYTEFPTGYFNDDAGYQVESVSDGSFDTSLFGSTLPSKYTTDSLPPLRDQSPYGACWAFATNALAEINLMKKGVVSSCDLSELHLSYFTYHWVDDPLSNFGSFKQPEKVPGVLDWGGNTEFGLNTYARWNGVSDESVANYKSQARDCNSNGLSDYIAFDDAAHVENYFVQPISADDLDPVKYLISTYGAVAVSMYAVNSTSGATSASFYNKDTNSYYNPSSDIQNHAVAIVGWDDDYSKDNFSIAPPGNGAWRVRNSWYTGSSPQENYTG